MNEEERNCERGVREVCRSETGRAVDETELVTNRMHPIYMRTAIFIAYQMKSAII